MTFLKVSMIYILIVAFLCVVSCKFRIKDAEVDITQRTAKVKELAHESEMTPRQRN